MKMNLRSIFILTAVAIMAVATPTTFIARADHDDTTFRARLTGFGEVPPKLVDGNGKFTGSLSEDGTSISWTLTWTGLTGPAQAAHIHFGQTQVNGGGVVFFCGGGGGTAGCWCSSAAVEVDLRVRTDPGIVAQSPALGPQPIFWPCRRRIYQQATSLEF